LLQYFSRSQSLARFCGFRCGRRCGGLVALAHGFVHDDGSGDRYVERRDLAGHGYPKKVIAGFFDEVVEACAFATKNEDAVGVEVEVGVVGGAALVEA